MLFTENVIESSIICLGPEGRGSVKGSGAWPEDDKWPWSLHKGKLCGAPAWISRLEFAVRFSKQRAL